MKLAEQYYNVTSRNETNLQILSLDLDYFKNINDTYGHETGDKVLVEFTKTVSGLLRKSDLFGRIGGEEFAIVLQNTPLDGATLFANRICKSVEEMEVSINNKRLHVTVSIGVATLSNEKSVAELLKKSDEALYKAKERGRNQVHVIK